MDKIKLELTFNDGIVAESFKITSEINGVIEVEERTSDPDFGWLLTTLLSIDKNTKFNFYNGVTFISIDNVNPITISYNGIDTIVYTRYFSDEDYFAEIIGNKFTPEDFNKLKEELNKYL